MVSPFRKWWSLPAIAGVFAMLTAFVMSQEAIEKQPRIVILFDISDSMNAIDGPEQPGRDPMTLPSRQDQVLRFLNAVKKGTTNTFLDELVKKAPVTAYRFGATPDHGSVVHFEAGKTWTADQWSRWLKTEPRDIDLRSGTNIAGSALEMLYAERDTYIQSVIIVSDGRGTRATRAEIDDFLEEVRDPRRPISVFTVGVGDPRPLPTIRFHELQAPRNVRPDDKFIVRVPIEGHGFVGEEFQVLLEAQRVMDGAGKPVAREKRYLPGPKTGKFTDSALQHVEFEIDVAKLSLASLPLKEGEASRTEGTWRFVARTPSHPREAFNGAEHVSEPIDVVVQDRKTRILLFSGGPTREFQFLRTLFYREALENRLDLSILLQNSGDGVDADPDLKRILKTFPGTLAATSGDKPGLASFDVIVALDPDWSAVGEKQLKLLPEWVAQGGSVIFAAGPVHTFQFARAFVYGVTPLLPILPVVLHDSRLHGLNLGGLSHDTSRPYALNFAPTAKNYPFLKLDDAGNSPISGWDTFFWGPNRKPEPNAKPARGFYAYYPVERLKPASQVLATFDGPKESRIGDKTDAFKDQQPYFVQMRHGSGITWYLGGQETWRLRQFREEYQARFWNGLVRFSGAASGNQVQKHGQILMGRHALVGTIPFDALVLGKDRQPLGEGTLKVDADNLSDAAAAPIVFDLKARAGEAGRFTGTLKSVAPGDYEMRIAIPGSAEALRHQIKVRAADREADDARVDFAALYELASDAKPLLAKLPADIREEVDAALRSSAQPGAEQRLFFRLSEARALPALLEKLPPKQMPKRDAPRKRPETKSAHDQVRKFKPTNVLIIDGEGAAGRKEGGDSYHVQNAIAAFRNGPYKIHFGDMETGAAAVKALERDDLAKYGVVLLLNVHELNGKQIANLEAFAKNGGGVAFFMGPLVHAGHYNKHLYKAGKGIFPAPLIEPFYPPPNENPLEAASEGLILRDDLVPKGERFPIFGEIFQKPQHRLPLNDFPVYRYFKVARASWRPEVNRSFELATLPNFESVGKFEQVVAELTRGSLKKLHADESFKLYRAPLANQIKAIEALALPGSDAKAYQLAAAFNAALRDKNLLEFWKDARVRPLFAELVNLHRQARLGDPLIVGGQFGKGRTIAVLTSAGKKWTDFPGGSLSSLIYAPFINEMLDHLSGQEPPPPEFVPELPKRKRSKTGPQLLDVAPQLEPRLPLNKNEKKDEGPVYLVTPDAIVSFAGSLRDDVGLRKAYWVVQVASGKDMKPEPELRVPLEELFAGQQRRALDEAIRDVLKGAKDKPFSTGMSSFHSLADEPGFDFRRHLGRLKGKGDVQPMYLVKIWLMAEGGEPSVVVRSAKPMLFLVASENEVLAQTMAPLEKIAERLELAQDSLRGAEVQLADQGERLKDPAANRETIAFRVEEVARTVQKSMTVIRESAVAAERIRRQLESNRVNKTQRDRAHDLVIALDSLTHGQKLRGVEDALSALAAGMEKGNADQLRRHAEDARRSLKALDKDAEKVLYSCVETCTELKLVSLLREIERRQSEHTRELERIQRLLIDELLKKN